MGVAETEAGFNNILGAMPELEQELKNLFAMHRVNFDLLPDTGGMIFQANSTEVRFTHQTLCVLWLLSFAAWRAVQFHSAALCWCRVTRTTFQSAILLSGRAALEADRKFQTALNVMHHFLSHPSSAGAAWPVDVPHPDNGPSSGKIDKLGFDLAVLGSAFIFAHEIKHIQFRQQRNSPGLGIPEETACDEFARELLFGSVDRYAAMNCERKMCVLDKRATGSLIAHFLFLEFSKRGTRQTASAKHPAVADRIKALFDAWDAHKLSANRRAWLFAGSILLAKLCAEGVTLPDCKISNYREFARSLIRFI